MRTWRKFLLRSFLSKKIPLPRERKISIVLERKKIPQKDFVVQLIIFLLLFDVPRSKESENEMAEEEEEEKVLRKADQCQMNV